MRAAGTSGLCIISSCYTKKLSAEQYSAPFVDLGGHSRRNPDKKSISKELCKGFFEAA